MNTIWKDKTVLIAEDVLSNYLLLTEYLEPTGVKILWASNGHEALEILNTITPDVVLMDMKMPVMSGFEAVIKIRETDQLLPIIAQTAYTMLGDKERILEVGCTDYIPKPYSEKVILGVLSKYMSQ